MRTLLLAVAIVGGPIACHAQGVITTVAGTGMASFYGDGGPATQAWLTHPSGIVVDGAGNFFFFDTGNSVVREVTAAGIMNTVAGGGVFSFSNDGDGGPATSAAFSGASTPFGGVAVDAAGNLYIADSTNHRVRIVTGGIINTFAGGGAGGDGGPATSAGLRTPAGLAIDSAGNVYVADELAGVVRKVGTNGIITTVAGGGGFVSGGDGGPATSAGFAGGPIAVKVDNQGNLYIAEGGGFKVRKVNAAGIISTVAGIGAAGFSGDGGPATSAALNQLGDLAVDPAGNLYIADYGNYRIRKVDTSGMITTIAGTGQIGGDGDGGLSTNARLEPDGLAFDASGKNLYVADYLDNRIRKIALGTTPAPIAASATALYFTGTPNSGAQPMEVNVFTLGSPISFTVSSTTSSGGGWLGPTGGGGTTPATILVNPQAGPSNLPAGTYTGTVTITPTTPGYTPITIAVTLVISATVPAKPTIGTNGLLNGASLQPGVVANAYLTIKGANLASATDTWNKSIVGGHLPTSLDGVTVTFNGQPGYLSYVSPTQINLVVPDVGGTAVGVTVNNNGSASANFTVQSSVYGPAFFSYQSTTQVIATRQDYSYVAKNGAIAGLTTVPAKPGDVLILWGMGFGPTTPPTLEGAVVPSDQTYATSALPTVTINSVPATVYGAALASGYAGLFQVAIQVPASLPNGDWPVVATIGGVSSPGGLVLTVQQ